MRFVAKKLLVWSLISFVAEKGKLRISQLTSTDDLSSRRGPSFNSYNQERRCVLSRKLLTTSRCQGVRLGNLGTK